MIKKLNYIFTRKQKIQLVFNSVLALFAAAFELLGVSAVIPLIGVILDPTVIETNKYYSMYADIFNAHTVKEFVSSFAMFLILIYIVKNVFLIIRYKLSIDFSYMTRKSMAINLMKYYLNQDYIFHVEHSAAELQRNVNTDVTAFNAVVFAILDIMVETFTCVSLLAFLLFTDLYTTIILIFIFAAIMTIIVMVYRKWQVRAGVLARNASGDMMKWLLQSLGGIKELKVLNREKFFLNKYDESYDRSISANKKYNMLTTCPKYVIELVAISGLLITVLIRINMDVDIKGFATTLSAFALVAIRMLPSFNRLTGYISTVMYNKASINALYDDMKEAENLTYDSISEEYQGDDRLDFKDKIEIRDVCFKYPEGDGYVFNKANMTVEHNQSVALIGESGAGKTTIADIMLGLLKPESGSVFVDDQNILDNQSKWHRTVGYIPQVIYLMDDSIRNNIAFGHKKIDDDKIWKALDKAQIGDFVRSLKNGLDTEIGDRGVRLSGGQRQRLGIARALYSEPEVLFLDEATSALDSETEAAVMESINHLKGETTLIIIAHRLTTIRNCDCIYEVGNGVIVERNKDDVFNEEIKKYGAKLKDE